ncbi:MAG: GNAT family N-acetyltransferase [Rhizobiaceae bacterium]
MITIGQIALQEDIEAVRDLVRALTTWAMSLDPDTADAPTFGDLEAELSSLPGKFAPPTGGFLLARDGREAVGCGALIALDDGVVELKRMFVKPNQRGKGVGTRLVEALIEQARELGARRIILDSYHKMHSAHHIYRQAGFKDVDPWEGFPEDFIDRVVFMEMDLS